MKKDLKLKVIYEDNHILVVEKPCNIPMQEDSSKDSDLLNICKEYIKEKYNKPGNVYLGLVHRLDRPVSGVCVFARTSKAAERLSKMVADRTIRKTYLAVVEDKNGSLKDSDVFTDRLLKDPKTNTTRVDPKGKDAKLDYQLIRRMKGYALVEVHLHTGRSHQIRVQFSSRGHALFGDQRYNRNAKPGEQIALHAWKLSFTHPVTKEEMTFTSPVERYPFDI